MGAPPALDPEAATEAWLGRVVGEERARSDAYFEGGYWIGLFDFLIGGAVLVVLLRRGVTARMRDLGERVFSRTFGRAALFWALYFAATTLLLFPWAVYTDFVREHAYGLATQDFAAWLVDRGKGFGLGLCVGALALGMFYVVVRRVGRRWWVWGSALAILFVVFGLAVAPVFVAPMFNTYTPLEDGPVRTAVLRMARANGVPAEEVWMSDASRQSTRISANVSGLLGTERITLNDNLLSRCSVAEVEAVMGHELGHYVLNHVWEGVLFFGVVIVGGFAFAAAVFEAARRRFFAAHVRGIDDPAGLPLLALAFSAYFFALTPVTNTYVRANEAEADLFGLNAARRPDGFAEVSLKLGDYRKLDPGPVEEIVFFDHPSGRARIRMAMEWKAAQGGPP